MFTLDTYIYLYVQFCVGSLLEKDRTIPNACTDDWKRSSCQAHWLGWSCIIMPRWRGSLLMLSLTGLSSPESIMSRPLWHRCNSADCGVKQHSPTDPSYKPCPLNSVECQKWVRFKQHNLSLIPHVTLLHNPTHERAPAVKEVAAATKVQETVISRRCQ